VRIKKLRIFTLFFVILVLCAVYGLAWLRTYTFKVPPANSSTPAVVRYAVNAPLNQVDPAGK